MESEDLVNRFTTKVIKGIKVGESPEWLRERLEAYGIPCINNIVDITNFVMVEYGQPLHAQDLSKFQKKEIVLRRAKKGEKIVTLLGGTVNLDPEVLILAQNLLRKRWAGQKRIKSRAEEIQFRQLINLVFKKTLKKQ